MERLRQTIKAKIHRTRGGHALRNLLALVDDMNQAQLQDLWTLLQNLESDAESTGACRGAQQPWRRW